MRNDVFAEGIRKQGIRSVFAALAVGFGLLGSAASAQAVTITAGEECCVFVGGPFSQPAGATAAISNPGAPNTAAHNVYSDGFGPDGGPLFFSSLAQPGQTRQVRGTEYLGVGSYDFVCTLPAGMTGSLEVTGGTPAPRPRAVPRIPSQSLATVRRKGKLMVTLRSAAPSGRVLVVVKVGRKAVGSATVASLAAGKTRRQSVTLSKRGKRMIAKGRSVKFQARAVAEFGIPASSSRTLRSRSGR
jgi:hypothetical protein